MLLCIFRLIKKNRTIIGKILGVVRLLGRLNLPFRGHREGECSQNKGVFKEFIEHMATVDPLMEDHLKNCAGKLIFFCSQLDFVYVLNFV